MLSYATLSNPGGRKVNEDSVGVFVDGENAVFVLADGLGGHGKGEIASGIAVNEAINAFKKDKNDLNSCFLNGQKKILEEQQAQNAENEMKTTAVVLKINGKVLKWGHVGDSRIYFFRKNKIVTRSLDHSVPQMLVASGEIKEKDIRYHEDRNRLIRVMGIEWSTPKYEISGEYELKEDDSFLLCSDGFWELVDEKHMQKLLKAAKTPREWLSTMEREVRKNGRNKNMDNYSAVAVFYRKSRA